MSCPSEKNAEKKDKGAKPNEAPVSAEGKKSGGQEVPAGENQAEPGAPEKTEAGEGEKLTTPEETRKGFRPECYELIEKNITKDTKMIVVKQRYRLGDNTSLIAGGEFVAGQMDARIILAAMNRFHIVPLEHKQLEGEHRQVFVARMMKIYSPDVKPSTCGKKNDKG